MISWWSVLLVLLCLFLVVAIPLSIILRSYLKYLTSKKYFKALPRYHETMAMIGLFNENGVKKMFANTVDKEGNLKEEAFFIGPHLDGTPTCFVNNAEHFKELLTEEKFPKQKLIYDSLIALLGDGLVTSTGDLWKRQRKLLTPLFHYSKLKQMPDIMINRIDNLCEKLHQWNGKEVKATSLFGTLTLEIVIDCVFGGPRYLDAEVMDPLWETANKESNLYFLGRLLLGERINNLLPFPWNLKFFKSTKEVRRMIDRAIILKREDLNQAEGQEDSDLLASLLSVRDENTGEGIPDELIRDEAMTFLFAGHDTTSSLLSWCMLMLSKRDEVVQKIREEISDVLGSRTTITFDDIKKFHYCDMVLKETLRMCPPVPLLDREVAQDIKLGEYTYKGGVCVLHECRAGHYDKRFWKDPFEFRPERFDPARKNIEPVPNPYAFVPFSAGSRNCIGKRFSLIEATIALVSIIRQFDVATRQTEEEINWVFEGTMKPVNFYCSFIPLAN